MTTIDADAIGHRTLRSDGPAFAEVAARWPRVVVDGEIVRSELASIVFANSDQLAALESITHPHIFGMISAQVEDIDSTVVVEIPLLGHALGEGWRRIVVDCRDESRLQRAIDRGMRKEDIEARMARQPSRREWLAAADIVAPNHGSIQELSSTVARLLPKL